MDAKQWMPQLIALLFQYFQMGFSNHLIRELYKDGIDLIVEDYKEMKSYHVWIEPVFLTDEFLKDARKLRQEIMSDLKRRNICKAL